MKCPNCGTEFDTKFCPNCGFSASSIEGEQKNHTTQHPENAPSNDNAYNYGYASCNPVNQSNQFSSQSSAPKPIKPKWYTKTWVIILFIIFFWPIGLFLMWRYKKNWSKIVKIIITVLVVVIALFSCSGGDDQTSDTKTESSSKEEDIVAEEKKTLEGIAADYSGSTEAGTMLDSNNSGISVTASYDDGSTEKITEFTIDAPQTLVAEQSSKVTIAYENATCELEVLCTTISPETYKSQCQDIAYTELARTPDVYLGQYVRFTGEIIQVQESGDDATYRINVTKDDYGFWDDTIIASFDLSNSSSRFLEDDIVTFYGQYEGLYTYTSILGSSVTVPSVAIEYMDLAQ